MSESILSAVRTAKAAAVPKARTLTYHPTQVAFWTSEARFNAVCAGRRSGKSDIALRRLCRKAFRFHLTHPHVLDGKFVVTAPTRDQVKRLHWERLKQMVPARLCSRVSESELCMTLQNGLRIQLVGTDHPERAEGESIDHCLIDEVADTKPTLWTLSIRPSLATLGREGTTDMIGKPRGRNHWWQWWTEAANLEDWKQFHWNSEDILDPTEIQSLKRDLDPISYDQEVRANFVNFTGRAYYAYFEDVHGSHKLEYDSSRALDFHFDFNVEPGVAGVTQEQEWEMRSRFSPIYFCGEHVIPWIQGRFTAGIGEVWIPKDSNTLRVVRQLIKDWGEKHRGLVNVYGDATGGQRRSSALAGSDWDIVRRELRHHNWQVRYHVPDSNPDERERVNSVNARLMTISGQVKLMLDKRKMPHHCEDLESVPLKDDGSGAIDKHANQKLTHASDGLGYKLHRISPVKAAGVKVMQV